MKGKDSQIEDKLVLEVTGVYQGFVWGGFLGFCSEWKWLRARGSIELGIV